MAGIPNELEAARNVSLATFRRTGEQVNTPVWCIGLDARLYINTGAGSFKVKRLRAHPAVRVAPCTMSGQLLGAWRDGTARVVDEPGLVRRVGMAMRKKYWSTRLTPLLGLFSRRFSERVIVEVTLGPA